MKNPGISVKNFSLNSSLVFKGEYQICLIGRLTVRLVLVLESVIIILANLNEFNFWEISNNLVILSLYPLSAESLSLQIPLLSYTSCQSLSSPWTGVSSG